MGQRYVTVGPHEVGGIALKAGRLHFRAPRKYVER
jgi:hypothetical protein